MAKILSGKLVSARVKEELKEQVAALTKAGTQPGLAVVIVGDDLMNVRLGGIKARAFLYLHHHRGDGIDGALLLFCRLLGRAGEKAEDNRRDEDKKYFLHTNKGIIIQTIYRIYDKIYDEDIIKALEVRFSPTIKSFLM